MPAAAMVRLLALTALLVATSATADGPPALPQGWKLARSTPERVPAWPDGPALLVWRATDDRGVAVRWRDGWTYVGRNEQGHHAFTAPVDGSTMLWVPAGSFVRGGRADLGFLDERPRAEVELRGYYIGRHEVTWARFARFCAATRRALPRRPESAGDDHPVTGVDWAAARDYCRWARLRLPTEAEWERAARGVDGRAYPWGDGACDGERANFADRRHPRWGEAATADDGHARTAPVGSYPAGASPVGALDMAGNVSEWCAGRYRPRAYDGDDRPAPADPRLRVDRGGSWDSDPFHLRTIYRGPRRPEAAAPTLGFRPAR